jgi:hypothetical protein
MIFALIMVWLIEAIALPRLRLEQGDRVVAEALVGDRVIENSTLMSIKDHDAILGSNGMGH